MRTPTKLVVLLCIAALVVYDIVAYAIGGVGSTISRVTLAWTTDLPIVLVGVGVVIGHLFWPQRPKEKP